MKKIVFGLLIFCSWVVHGQEFVVLTVEPAYANQVYYSFENDQVSSVENTSWDLAFTAYGDLDAGIHVNESVKLDFSSPPPGTELYLAPTSDFNDTIKIADVEARLFNDEESWAYGAVNSVRDTSDANDYGWGQLNPQTGAIEGREVFVLHTRDDRWLKFKVESLEDLAYTIRYADLDGANEQVLVVDKKDYPNSDLIFYSFQQGEFKTDIHNGWDLFFGRYLTLVPDGQGGGFALTVTGTLSGVGVEVAEADGVDPQEVEFSDYRDSLSSTLDVIGYDWKEFDNTAWAIVPDKVYFVKTSNNHLWKMQFFDFGGSSDGEIIFEKTDLGLFSDVEDLMIAPGAIDVFPNPGTGRVWIGLELDKAMTLQFKIVSMDGSPIWQSSRDLDAGFQLISPANLNIPSGMYTIHISNKHFQVTRKFIRY